MSYYQKNRRSSYGRNKNFNRNRRFKQRGPKKENIHPSRYVKAAKIVDTEDYKPKNSFADFKVAPTLARNIADKGFAAPLPIQDEAIPLGLKGSDIIGIANTGTGKTAAFAIPVLNALMQDRNSKALIMAPTRELAEQILQECKSLARGGNVFWALLIGGSSMHYQLKDLSRRPNLIIGTPGRIKDHVQRKSLELNKFNIVVLDEVDRMLDMGFVGDMREILGKLNTNRQSFFFSATMDSKVRNLIDEFSNAPESISVKSSESSDNVEQNIVSFAHSGEKIEKLHELLINDRKNKVLIFDETRRSVESLAKILHQRGFKSDSIHGGKSQGQRKRALSKFKDSHTTVLVATDVAARGIDIRDITHVINYSTPQSYDDYIHRIGRAGRAGRKGHALTFIKS